MPSPPRSPPVHGHDNSTIFRCDDWHRCLFALGKDLARELEVVEDVAGDNPKNYQYW